MRQRLNLHVRTLLAWLEDLTTFRVLMRSGALFLVLILAANTCPAQGALDGKVFVGYQGWFRCPDDGSPLHAWNHWSRGAPAPDTMAVDLYPDTSELPRSSVCPITTELVHGQPAQLFSSYPAGTADVHLSWMEQFGIDGLMLQRFTNAIPGLRAEGDSVLKNVRVAAEKYHRSFLIEYDVSGDAQSGVFGHLKQDWQYLSNELRVTASPAYLHVDGKPVVSIWGLGFNDGYHLDNATIALQVISWFKQQAGAVVIGGVPAGWGYLSGDSVSDPGWARVYAALDIVQPWTVGRYTSLAAADEWKSTHLQPDFKKTAAQKQQYMPVIFPGFSWHNLNRDKPGNEIPRLGGNFLWEQAYNAKISHATFVKIAMFDEVNEGTAIFKAVSSRGDAPSPGYWLTLDADGQELPSDWYLRVAHQISCMFKDEIRPTPRLPVTVQVDGPIPGALLRKGRVCP
jgi:hypothetical protein